MLRRFANFIQYHNGFTLLAVLLVLGSGTALANDEVREQVGETLVSSEETVVSVDNSYIVQVNLNEVELTVQIAQVEEDDVSYYVTYEYEDIDLIEGRWVEVLKEDVLVVNKEQLGERDLGLHAAEELEELRQSRLSYLNEVQEIERSLGESEKKVERTYAGLVGRFLDADEETFDGYDPVAEEPVKIVKNTQPESELEGAADSDDTDNDENGEGDSVDNNDDSTATSTTATSTNEGSDTATSTDTGDDTSTPAEDTAASTDTGVAEGENTTNPTEDTSTTEETEEQSEDSEVEGSIEEEVIEEDSSPEESDEPGGSEPEPEEEPAAEENNEEPGA